MSLIRYFHTIRYLRWQQIFYRLYYPLKRSWYKAGAASRKQLDAAANFPQIDFFRLRKEECWNADNNSFCFLNKEKSFGAPIDWNEPCFGKLWTYHLNYHQFLNASEGFSKEKAKLIDHYCTAELKDGLEPYPISLRAIEWIKFFSVQNIRNEAWNKTLYLHCARLSAFPEYHLLGNHLLENGFALFFAAHYFNDQRFYEQSAGILQKELVEQILNDGAHYERSPMYHCLLLGQLLSCIQLQNNPGRFENGNLQRQMNTTAARMSGWLKQFCYSDGSYAMMGDAAPEMAPEPERLFEYAKALNIQPELVKPSDSGYRIISGAGFELRMNTGELSSAYQPGHAHADGGSFCLYVQGKPLIVDMGVSTYQAGERRSIERGTAAHNTVSIEGMNSSEVWASFRMGKRAGIETTDKENGLDIVIGHAGGVAIHNRSFRVEGEVIHISDKITITNKNKALLHLHFHPGVSLTRVNENNYKADGVEIRFQGVTQLTTEPYLFAAGFNCLQPAERITAIVATDAKTEIDCSPC